MHVHLDHCYFEEDLDMVISDARKNGIKIINNCGINPEKNRKTLELAEKYDIVKASLGIYPTDSLKLTEEEFDSELDFIKENKKKIIAIGEVGLDYLKKEEIVRQKNNFLKIIELAEKIKKPLIVHSRKAEEDAVYALESSKLKKIVMHCFCGNKNLVKKGYGNGWFFTIPTNVVRSFQFQDLIKTVDLSHLFCETDSPYLSPFKDKRNEPSFVIESYKKIAEIKSMDINEVANNIYMNYQNLFG